MSVVRRLCKPWGPITSIVILSVICDSIVFTNSDHGSCPIRKSNAEPASQDCGPKISLKTDGVRYVLYGVNGPEGFNLRRDVYMRMAVFINKLNKKNKWMLVLPPWERLYHWHSRDIEQIQLPWSMFFDVESLQKFAPVIEFYELFEKWPGSKKNVIDQVFVLQHFKDLWSENKIWEDKWAVEECSENIQYTQTQESQYSGPFWNYKNITAEKVDCVSYQGPASKLKEILETTDSQSVMFDHAEVALHDYYGQAEYWQARRSMRFAKKLVHIANDFRNKFLNSTDNDDGTIQPPDWIEETPGPHGKGGPYLGIHLRRRDFVWGRPQDVPSIGSAAQQISDLLSQLKLNKVFIATDAEEKEFDELKSLLDKFEVYRFNPNQTVRNEIKDGGVAIVDQIICSHAAYFAGTHESTFSFRIQEEREILGFDQDTTFNRLCGRTAVCVQPTRWSIVY